MINTSLRDSGMRTDYPLPPYVQFKISWKITSPTVNKNIVYKKKNKKTLNYLYFPDILN